uniref:Uncharacterized protein n=1 Tax=Thermogemmatispora argillosa TaxID=2045280 RepID=A0A455SZ04_9CHLR|nr:hypothetical protein KTA_09670 [Thermogemmatispora argillosa]
MVTRAAFPRRYLLEYALLAAIALSALILGVQWPIEDWPAASAPEGQFSLWFILGSNLLLILCIALGSALTGGFMGGCVIFENLFVYGRVLHLYWHDSPLAAAFPWFEFSALIIATQVGLDLFWSLLRGWPIHLKTVYLLLSVCLFLLMAAAIIEGGMLHV